MKANDEQRFLLARPGDALVTPFQCDYCWFVNLKKRAAREDVVRDVRLMEYIRRVNLDIMWSRERSTVANTVSNLRKAEALTESLSLPPVNLGMEAWPIGDPVGFQIAIQMLMASRRPGRNDADYTQFDSIRKIRSAYANVLQVRPAAVLGEVSFKAEHGRVFAMSGSPTDSIVFRLFIKGCEKRMGRLVVQEMGLSLEMMLGLVEELEMELADAETGDERRRELTMARGAFLALYGGALRGGEVLLTEGSELVRLRMAGKSHPKYPHVVLPLMGRFKGETGERNVLFALGNVSHSGLNFREALEGVMMILVKEKRYNTIGPAFCTSEGKLMPRWRLNGILHEMLARVQANTHGIIMEEIKIEDKFSIHRSFRRGAHTRATEAEVPDPVIKMNNRWRKVEQSGGSVPKLPMAELYTEISQALNTKTSFSRAL